MFSRFISLTDNLMIENQRLIFEKNRFVLLEKSDHSQLMTTSGHEVCDAITISGNVKFLKSSEDWNFLMETMTTGNEKFVLKRNESVYKDACYNYALLDFLLVSSCPSELTNTEFDSRVAKN